MMRGRDFFKNIIYTSLMKLEPFKYNGKKGVARPSREGHARRPETKHIFLFGLICLYDAPSENRYHGNCSLEHIKLFSLIRVCL